MIEGNRDRNRRRPAGRRGAPQPAARPRAAQRARAPRARAIALPHAPRAAPAWSPALWLGIAFGVLLAALLLFAARTASAERLTDVDEIVRRANRAAYYQGDDGRAQVRMTIVDAQGRQRRRQFTILRKDVEDQGDQLYFVRFERPADVRDTAFLVHKHVGRDDDRWLYLPGLDLVKRIAAGDKRTSFVGSDYYYEDISGRGLEEDTHELVATTDDCYRVKNVPKDEGSVEFAYYEVCVDPTTFIPKTIEYYDDEGELYRKVESLEVQEVDGHPTTVKAKLTNLRTGGFTGVQFRGVAYDVGLPESVFKERSMRNPPQQWLGR